MVQNIKSRVEGKNRPVEKINPVQRKSNIELLRIILMLMVVGVHYNAPGMGNAFSFVTPMSVNNYILRMLESICVVCVDTYVIITGYFMIESKKIKLDKVFQLIFLVLFYNVFMYIMEVIFGVNRFGLGELVKNLITGKWFITLYIVLYLLSISINLLLNQLSKKGYRCYLLILFIVFVIWPTLLDTGFGIIGKEVPVGLSTFAPNGGQEAGYHIVNFVLLYSIGGYIKKFHEKKRSMGYYLSIFLFLSVIIFLLSNFTDRVWNYDNLLVIINSSVIFLLFRNLNMKNYNWINKIASTTLAVFILHTSDFLNHIWEKLQVMKYCNSSIVVIHFLFSIVVVFMCCMFIDLIVHPVFNKVLAIIFKKVPIFTIVLNKDDMIE